ncbi:hypothetical protein MP638_003653 [Amoeboaphelidium occidentale]|nr:hypothetical protein MP638_003653 [Amoeboaphelidium occidentale]
MDLDILDEFNFNDMDDVDFGNIEEPVVAAPEQKVVPEEEVNKPAPEDSFPDLSVPRISGFDNDDDGVNGDDFDDFGMDNLEELDAFINATYEQPKETVPKVETPKKQSLLDKFRFKSPAIPSKSNAQVKQEPSQSVRFQAPAPVLNPRPTNAKSSKRVQFMSLEEDVVATVAKENIGIISLNNSLNDSLRPTPEVVNVDDIDFDDDDLQNISQGTNAKISSRNSVQILPNHRNFGPSWEVLKRELDPNMKSVSIRDLPSLYSSEKIPCICLYVLSEEGDQEGDIACYRCCDASGVDDVLILVHPESVGTTEASDLIGSSLCLINTTIIRDTDDYDRLYLIVTRHNVKHFATTPRSETSTPKKAGKFTSLTQYRKETGISLLSEDECDYEEVGPGGVKSDSEHSDVSSFHPSQNSTQERRNRLADDIID